MFKLYSLEPLNKDHNFLVSRVTGLAYFRRILWVANGLRTAGCEPLFTNLLKFNSIKIQSRLCKPELFSTGFFN